MAATKLSAPVRMLGGSDIELQQLCNLRTESHHKKDGKPASKLV